MCVCVRACMHVCVCVRMFIMCKCVEYEISRDIFSAALMMTQCPSLYVMLHYTLLLMSDHFWK